VFDGGVRLFPNRYVPLFRKPFDDALADRRLANQQRQRRRHARLAQRLPHAYFVLAGRVAARLSGAIPRHDLLRSGAPSQHHFALR